LLDKYFLDLCGDRLKEGDHITLLEDVAMDEEIN